MSQTTIEVRQQNPDEEENMAQFESPNEDAVCASYVSRNVADSLGEFATLTITDEADAEATLQKTTTNYGVYEVGNAVKGLYINLDQFEGDEPPETIGLQFASSDEEAFEEARDEIEEEEEEEAEALLADGESDDEEEEVEISDEELDLVEQ